MADNQPTCCICLGSLDRDGRQVLQCGHVLHERCITAMRRQGASDRCPLCRESLEELESVQDMLDRAVMLKLRTNFGECYSVVSDAYDIDPENIYVNRFLAEFYHHGRVVSKDADRAIELYEVASRGGDLEGSLEKAKRSYEAASQGGILAGTLNLGLMYLQALRDVDKAKELFEVCSRAGDSEAFFYLLVEHTKTDTLEKAMKVYDEDPWSGHLNEICRLASKLATDGDVAKAMMLYEAASRRGHLDATFCLGRLYERVADRKKAMMLYELASQGGHMSAYANLGTMYYEDGNDESAFRSLQIAAIGGNLNATTNLGTLCHQLGDSERAMELYKKASCEGHSHATYKLGNLHEDQGNMDLAMELYELASCAGHRDAVSRLAELHLHVPKKTTQLGCARTLETCGAFVIGDTVSIHGLTSQAGLPLNGCKGQVMNFNDNNGRFGVHIFGGHGLKSVHPKNLCLEQLPPTGVIDLDPQGVIEQSLASAAALGSGEADVNAQLSEALVKGRSSKVEGHHVVVMSFSRSPKAFRQAIFQAGGKVGEYRQALQDASLPIELANGAKMLVHPWQYQPAIDACRLWLETEGALLHRQHVVADPMLVHHIEQLIQDIPKSEKIYHRGKTPMPIGAASSIAQMGLQAAVEKTFLTIKVPSSLLSATGSGPCTVSTTDTDARKGKNSRRHRKKRFSS